MNIYNALIYKKLYGGGGGGEIEVESLTATENKTYNAGEGKAYNPVVVAIPEPTLISKSITANGTYNASADNADGYSSVSVNVPLPDNAYLLQTIEHEQVATFTDGTDNFLKSLEVAIEPQQEGSGDPSPDNIRPITGQTEVVIEDCGKNLVSEIESGMIDIATGRDATSDVVNRTKGYIPTNPSTAYTFSGLGTDGNIRVFGYGKDKSFLGSSVYSSINKTVTLTVSENTYFIRAQADNTIINTTAQIQCEQGSTATEYEPYKGKTYTIDLNGTRYGGTLDVVNGELVVTDGYIASYNGETLPSTWISDRDVYAEGTTPTIGAEVCYKLATPQTIQLTPTIIKSLQGENNLFASTGEIELLQYWSKEA